MSLMARSASTSSTRGLSLILAEASERRTYASSCLAVMEMALCFIPSILIFMKASSIILRALSVMTGVRRLEYATYFLSFSWS